MINRIACLLVLEMACTDAPARELPEQVTFSISVSSETAAPPESVAAFSRYIQRNIKVWNDGLVELGCEPPFVWTPESPLAHSLVMLADDVTTRFPANGGGYFDGRNVWLQANTDGTYDQTIRIGWPAIVQHELGHALGLPHNMRDDSVMGPAFSLVHEGDLEDAAKSIGCL